MRIAPGSQLHSRHLASTPLYSLSHLTSYRTMSAPPPHSMPVPPHMQGKAPQGDPGGMSSVKREAPCTAALHPSYFKYVLEHTGETEVQRELRDAAEQLSRPGMMACPDHTSSSASCAASSGRSG